MRGSKRIAGAWIVLALCAGAAPGAGAAERDPVTGGIISDPTPGTAPDLAAAEAAAMAATEPVEHLAPAAPQPADEDTSVGIVLRGGYFGLPDAIADRLFRQHPKVAGTLYGAEVRYYGESGGRGVSSVGLAVDRGSAKADGFWQADEFDPPQAASGEIEMLAVTVTGYWSIFPRWYLHPFVGIGIGVAHLKGSYRTDDDLTEVDYWVPALHLPVGLAVEFGPRLQLAVEARFIDGIAAGGSLQARF